MDDEAKQLLRDIRGIAVRDEARRKRFMRFVVLLVFVLLVAIAYLVIQLDGLMREV
jgi:hypothetical protein